MSDMPPDAEPVPPEEPDRNGCILGMLGAVVALALLSVGACVFLVANVDSDGDGDGDGGDGGGDSEAADVGEPTCQVDADGHVEAVMVVTNPTSERSNYIIRVVFDDADGDEIDSEALTVDAVPSGQQASARAVTDTAPPADGQFTCRVTDVERFSDE
jgi:hypothetical protein